jgi:hypothetical protein
MVIFETNFYRSKIEHYFEIQNQKHTVFKKSLLLKFESK